MKKINILFFIDNDRLRSIFYEVCEIIQQDSIFNFLFLDQKKLTDHTTDHVIMDDKYLDSNPDITQYCKKIFLIVISEKYQSPKIKNIEIINNFIPLRVNELLSRILKDIKQTETQLVRKLSFVTFNYDPGMRTLSNKENSLRFTEKEDQIFQCLLNNSNTYISKKVLLQKVWSYDENIDTHTLETHIYALRKKISKRLALKDLIIFEENKGYYLDKSIL